MGYVTEKLSNVIDNIARAESGTTSSYIKLSTFITVTVQNTEPGINFKYPGSFHPYTGSILYQYLMKNWLNAV